MEENGLSQQFTTSKDIFLLKSKFDNLLLEHSSTFNVGILLTSKVVKEPPSQDKYSSEEQLLIFKEPNPNGLPHLILYNEVQLLTSKLIIPAPIKTLSNEEQ